MSLVILDNKVIGGVEQKIIKIKTSTDHLDHTKPFNYEVVEILVSDIKPYKTKIVDGRVYAY